MTTESQILLAWIILLGPGIGLPLYLGFKKKPSSDGEKNSMIPSLSYQKKTGMFLYPKHPYIALAIYDSLLIWAIYVLLTNP